MARLHTYFMGLAVACAALATATCERSVQKAPAIAEAFAGPITLNVRQEISPASKTIGTAKHGEKLEVLQIRRRFVRVRTPQGQEGWTDSRNLLTAEQMKQLAEMGRSAARLPSQGKATVFATLNMHSDPTRNSTSFYQIAEGMYVDVVAHRLSPRSSGQLPPAFQAPKPAPAPKTRRRKEPSGIPPPPPPPPPGLPPNWLELSKSPLPPPPPPPPEPVLSKPARKKPVKPKTPMEDWYLVRTQDGKAGWVLARMINMAIPDEVAQYSEGARITSYFALSDVRDGEELKHHWLWTTIRDGQQPYQFDSFRVFTWVVRRHRFETAYIERGIEGYYPVTAEPGPRPKFSLILRGPDGKLYRKTYLMEGYLVRKIADELYEPSKEEPGERVISNLPPEETPSEPAPSLSLGDRLRNLFRRTGASAN